MFTEGLTIVHSPAAAIQYAADPVPPEVVERLAHLQRTPQRCLWIVPTSRQRRALQRHHLAASATGAMLFPGFHTLETLVAEALEYSLRQRPRISGPERLLRLARAWQEVTGRSSGPGLARQIDRFTRDWMACTLSSSQEVKDSYERVVQRYLRDLSADGRLDRISSVALLTEEVSDPESWPNQLFFSRVDTILFDGFQRLEPVELNLIAALSHRADVLVWLVGVPGSICWKTIDEATRILLCEGCSPTVVAHEPAIASPLAEVGRRLFTTQPASEGRAQSIPVYKLEVPGPAAELEMVARRIKEDFQWSQETDRPLRLSDVAVVIPGPAYDPLLREIFPRAGLEFSLAGRALLIATSRPARVLLAALDLVRGRWRYDLLLDFLNQPLVKRRLQEEQQLYHLIDERPRSRQQLSYLAWRESWQKHLARLQKNIADWETGERPVPDWIRVSREEFLDRQKDLAASLKKLIQALEFVLRPVAALDDLLAAPARKRPLQELVRIARRLLQNLRIDEWLTPPTSHEELGGGWTEPAVLWVEYEKDQRAYEKLLTILDGLAEGPESRIPLTPQNQPDLPGTLQLALDGETYQIKTEDDAGVQIFEIREIRGLRFRHVYVLGMVDGKMPALLEEDILANRRRLQPCLRQQLEQKETELAFLFSQLFETAEERLVLSRPTMEEDQDTLPSRFLTAVEQLVHVPPLPAPSLLVSMQQAARCLGRAGKEGGSKALAEIWPSIESADADELERHRVGLAAWKGREQWPHKPVIEVPALLQRLFPEQRPFSASELESYAACPFRYFGTHVLRLEERDPDRTRLHFGLLVHRVLHLLYVEKRARQTLPALSPDDRGRLLEIFRQEVDQFGEGAVPPDLESLFGCEEGLLDFLLQVFPHIESGDSGYGNLVTELSLPAVKLGADSAGRPVLLSGKIDRVDVRRTATNVAIVVDYKTGRIGSPSDWKTKTEDGRMLQLPLYGLALQSSDLGLTVVGGAYIHLSDRKRSDERSPRNAILPTGEVFEGKASPVPFDMEKTRLKALEIASEIRAGRFSLTTHTRGNGDTECTSYCTMRHACRHPEGYQAPFDS